MKQEFSDVRTYEQKTDGHTNIKRNTRVYKTPLSRNSVKKEDAVQTITLNCVLLSQ